MLKNMAKFALVESIGGFFMILGKILISSFTSFVGYIILTTQFDEVELNSPLGPIVFIFLISYMISAVFMSVYSTTANTILQCFLVDLEIQASRGRDEAQHTPDSLKNFIEHATKK
jgi:hypothetical protein